jgi:hypothetical protein
VVVAVAVVAVACTTDSPERVTGAASAREVAQTDGSPREDVPSALETIHHPDVPEPLVAEDDLLAGGPPPDGIPPVDEPRFLDVGEVDFLADSEPVLAVEVGGEARAYPVQIMIWHEIVNDRFGDVPVSVTYCPLCNTAVAFDRRSGDRVLTFSTSGMLYRSALVMYDRQTESLWSHFDGTAIAGTMTGTELTTLPVATVSWKDWREAHPDGLVLSRDTGEERPYGENPYPGYDDVESDPFLFDGEVDGRLAAKERVVGFGLDDRPTAILHSALAERGVLEVEVAGRPAVAWSLPGTASALDTFEVADGRDVGATGVFLTEVDGRVLRFRRDGEGFVDEATGSRWSVLGVAEAGPLMGARLEPVEHVDTFWFAWAAFSPDTVLLP